MSIGNVLSFRDEVELSLIASSERGHAGHKRMIGSGKRYELLKLALVYGPNASGKSNFVQAIRLFQNLLRDGTTPDGQTGLTPFRLDPDCADKPSRFECTFVVDDILYTYGIVADADNIHEEWMFAEPLQKGKRERTVFERSRVDGEDRIEIGQLLAEETEQGRSFLVHVAEGTRHNQPFLTELVLRKVAYAETAWRWMTHSMILVGAFASYGPLVHRADGDERFVRFLSDALRTMNTGISRLEIDSHVVSESFLPNGMSKSQYVRLKEELDEGESVIRHGTDGSRMLFRKESDDELHVATLKSVHKGKAGEDVLFDFADESDGTRRMIDLLPVLLDQESGGRVFIIDELDRSLHTHLVRWFLEQFLSSKKSDSQLVATSHDTNLLDQGLIRRDEAWLVEKDGHGASELYSLVDFNLRKDLALENAYLNGRFGAVPFSSNVPLYVNEPLSE